MGGGKEKKKQQIVYRQPDERRIKKAETKAFPNTKPYKTYYVKKTVRPTLS
jgi:hypothetical protein